MSSPPYKPSEGKREEYRKYLEKTGVMDTLTKVLVSLYEEAEKPEDAIAFIRDRLAIQAGLETHAQLHEKIEELKAQVAELESKLQESQTAAPPAEEAPAEAPAEPAPAEEGAAEPPAEEAPAEAPAE